MCLSTSSMVHLSSFITDLAYRASLASYGGTSLQISYYTPNGSCMPICTVWLHLPWIVNSHIKVKSTWTGSADCPSGQKILCWHNYGQLCTSKAAIMINILFAWEINFGDSFFITFPAVPWPKRCHFRPLLWALPSVILLALLNRSQMQVTWCADLVRVH